MIYVLSLLAIVLSLLLVVGIHEAGHAGAAYYFKIKIKIISIGFGRALFRWKDKAGRQWVWALWPLGGYVQLLNSRIEPVAKKDYSVAFDKKPVWVRCIVLLSGALANIVIAWLALVFMLMLGFEQTSPTIATIKGSSVASVAGLKDGDRLISIAGQNVMSWQEAGMQLIMALGRDSVVMEVGNKAGHTQQVQLDLKQWRYSPAKETLLATLGIEPNISSKARYAVRGLSLLPACQQAFIQLMQISYFFLVVLKQLLTGIIPFGLLLGPLGALSLMAHSFLQGMAVFLYFIANFSLAVALINLLPIPGLDGGSIIYALIEKIRGKPVSIAMEVLIHRLLLIAFFVLLIQLVLNDLGRWLHQ